MFYVLPEALLVVEFLEVCWDSAKAAVDVYECFKVIFWEEGFQVDQFERFEFPLSGSSAVEGTSVVQNFGLHHCHGGTEQNEHDASVFEVLVPDFLEDAGCGVVCFDERRKLVDDYGRVCVFVPFCEFLEKFDPVFGFEFCEARVIKIAAHSLFKFVNQFGFRSSVG